MSNVMYFRKYSINVRCSYVQRHVFLLFVCYCQKTRHYTILDDQIITAEYNVISPESVDARECMAISCMRHLGLPERTSN